MVPSFGVKGAHLIIAAVIRESLYIDGGYIWWLPGLSDGTYGAPNNDGINLESLFEMLNKLT